MRRTLVLVAIVALLLVSAVDAQQTASSRRSSKSSRGKCAKTFPGCKKCSGSGDTYTCISCGNNAEFLGDRCTCAATFGTFSQSEWIKYKRSQQQTNSRKRRNKYGKPPAGCVQCSLYAGCEANGGVCVYTGAVPSGTGGRRLLFDEEDVWA